VLPVKEQALDCPLSAYHHHPPDFLSSFLALLVLVLLVLVLMLLLVLVLALMLVLVHMFLHQVVRYHRIHAQELEPGSSSRRTERERFLSASGLRH